MSLSITIRCLGRDLPVSHPSVESEVIWSQWGRVINGEEEQVLRTSIPCLEAALGDQLGTTWRDSPHMGKWAWGGPGEQPAGGKLFWASCDFLSCNTRQLSPPNPPVSPSQPRAEGTALGTQHGGPGLGTPLQWLPGLVLMVLPSKASWAKERDVETQ